MWTSVFIAVLAICLSGTMLMAQKKPLKAKERYTDSNPSVSPNVENGIIKTINQTVENSKGIQLSNPFFKAFFAVDGVTVCPRENDLNWRWRLHSINGKLTSNVFPNLKENQIQKFVDFEYENVIERYLFHQKSIEQVFVIDSLFKDDDLCIEGEIFGNGKFEPKHNHWQWKNEEGAVTLGQLYVYDACGETLEADFRVTETSTEIFIDKSDLDKATFPITIDPEIGANDFQISDMGPNGDEDYDAIEPSVAYNSTDDEYLVVWRGDDLINGEQEIYGQRLAADGTEIGTNDFRISDMGPNGSTLFAAVLPMVVYNSTDNEYLVVWIGDDDTAPLVDNEYEVFGQRLAADGTEIGNNDFRISDMGPDGDTDYVAWPLPCSAAYNSTNNEYLVVWLGEDDIAPLVDNEREVFGQRLSNVGVEIGANDFRISDMGPNGDTNYGVLSTDVVYNPVFNNYLVVWHGSDDTGLLVEGEYEIYGQRLSSAGVEIGTNDFRISDMGPDGDISYSAAYPSVTYNSTNHEYFVVWYGDDNIPPLVQDEVEIFGQRLSVVGTEVGDNDFRISDMSANGVTGDHARTPHVTYNSTENEYLVIWTGFDIGPNAGIYVQHLTNLGAEVGDNDYRISESVWTATNNPFTTFNSTNNEYLVVWPMTSNVLPFTHGEYDIFGQRLSGSALPVELLSFSATKKQEIVQLVWETTYEQNNQGFEIERSLDGKDFERIGWKPGAGTSNERLHYLYEDKNIQKGQIYYYRLKQIDYDGQYAESEIVSIHIPNENSINIFPNPFQNSLFINARTTELPFTLKIFNQSGETIYVEKIEVPQHSIYMEQLPIGIYTITFWKNQELIFQDRLVKGG